MTTKPLEGLHAIAYARVSTDEDAIREGGRCWSYLSWLHAMHREECHAHDCEECLKHGIKTPADFDRVAYKHPSYICKACAEKLAKGVSE